MKGEPVTTYCFAGDGEDNVRAILIDLFAGAMMAASIEPHVATVFHADDNPEDTALQQQRRFDTFVSYGREFEQLVKHNARPKQHKNKRLNFITKLTGRTLRDEETRRAYARLIVHLLPRREQLKIAQSGEAP